MLDHSTKFKISIKITLNAISIYLCRIIRYGMHFANRRYTRHPAAQRFIAVHLFNELLNWNLNVFATCKLQSMQEFAIQWQLTNIYHALYVRRTPLYNFPINQKFIEFICATRIRYNIYSIYFAFEAFHSLFP